MSRGASNNEQQQLLMIIIIIIRGALQSTTKTKKCPKHCDDKLLKQKF